MFSTTPQSFIDGFRLIDGTELNDKLANPQWSTTTSVTATPGGNVNTSIKVVDAITNITSAVANAGITIPQALPGKVLVVSNSTANPVIVYAAGGSTIGGVPGNVGISLTAYQTLYIFAVDTQQWMFSFALPTQLSANTVTPALRALQPVAQQVVNVSGYYAIGDGGGGLFYAVTGAAPGTYVDNGGTIIVPTGGNGSSAWLRPTTGIFNVVEFGAKGNKSTDDYAAIQNAANAATDFSPTAGAFDDQKKAILYFPPRTGYLVSAGIVCSGQVNIQMKGTMYVQGAANVAVIGLDLVNPNGTYLGPRFSEDEYRIERLIQSDWTVSGDIGVRIQTQYQSLCYINWVAGFRTGVDMCYAYGDVRINTIAFSQYGLQITPRNNGAISTQFTNQMNIYNGEFLSPSNINGTLPRYGVYLKADPFYGMNAITFRGQSFEQSANSGVDAIAYLIDASATISGIIDIRMWGQRREFGSLAFMKCVGKVANVVAEIYDLSATKASLEQLVDNQSTFGNIFVYNAAFSGDPIWRSLFKFNYPAQQLIGYTGSLYSVRGLDIIGNQGAAPPTISPVGGFAALATLVDANGQINHGGSFFPAAKVKIGYNRTFMMRGNKVPLSSVTLNIICFDAAGMQLDNSNTTVKIAPAFNDFIFNGAVFNGLFYAGVSTITDASSVWEAVFTFSSNVAYFYVGQSGTTWDWELFTTDPSAEIQTLNMAFGGKYLVTAPPVPVTNVTYQSGMVANRYDAQAGLPYLYVYVQATSTWRPSANL